MKKHQSKKATIDKNQNQKGKKSAKKQDSKMQSQGKMNQSFTDKGRPITQTGSRHKKRK